ncbi:MAG: heme-binding domain-containing protein [Chloroflexi bacterium]|nr:heme-binding domain-containing protein [Chloroflexota bacterium]
MSRNRILIILGVVGVLVLVVVGNVATAHTNPPVTTAIHWNSPETEKLMCAACMDCHSNETRWPWYSYIAPMSFLVVKDVNEGREAMNLSTGVEVEGEEMINEIEEGAMPKPVYTLLHPDANLNAGQKAQLIAGIQATFGGEGGEGGEGDEGGESGEGGEGGEGDEGGKSGG